MKQTKQQIIPIHRMNTQFPLGMEFSYMEVKNEPDEITLELHKNIVHRDDYYLFMFVDAVEAVFTIDFEEMQVSGNTVLYVCPGQVHVASSIKEAKGWSLAIDAMLVEKDYKNIFEGQFLTQKPITLDMSVSARMNEVAHLLHSTIQAKPTAFSDRIILNLTNAFIGIIAEQYADRQDDLQHQKSRSALIAYQFKKLLSDNFRTLKSPTQYAQMLNYSLSHLNESVKNTTGFPVSYWIHQQIILEAKRLLYYTNMDVKEIAFSLGYDDHTYFSRLFSKFVGVSPSTFRRRFHE